MQKLPKGVINIKLIGQLIDAAGSVGANYREANEALSKKDFVHRMKITRKECKESSYHGRLRKRKYEKMKITRYSIPDIRPWMLDAPKRIEKLGLI